MDSEKTGSLIKRLRNEQHMTQQQLAEKLHVSDKTISKWERGCGLPQVSLLPHLAQALHTDIGILLEGNIPLHRFAGGNMKQTKFYVCGTCGSITLCTGEADIACCGKKLAALQARKAQQEEKLCVQPVENEWYLTSSHPMRKDDYISFVAFATGNKVELVKQYPEWDFSLRLPRQHGNLLWYSAREGLLYQRV